MEGQICYKHICRLTPAVFVTEVRFEKTDTLAEGGRGLVDRKSLLKRDFRTQVTSFHLEIKGLFKGFRTALAEDA